MFLSTIEGKFKHLVWKSLWDAVKFDQFIMFVYYNNSFIPQSMEITL